MALQGLGKRTALLIVENAFNCSGSPYGFDRRGSRGSRKKWPRYRNRARLSYVLILPLFEPHLSSSLHARYGTICLGAFRSRDSPI